MWRCPHLALCSTRAILSKVRLLFPQNWSSEQHFIKTTADRTDKLSMEKYLEVSMALQSVKFLVESLSKCYSHKVETSPSLCDWGFNFFSMLPPSWRCPSRLVVMSKSGAGLGWWPTMEFQEHNQVSTFLTATASCSRVGLQCGIFLNAGMDNLV